MNRYLILYAGNGVAGLTNYIPLDMILDIEYLDRINMPPHTYGIFENVIDTQSIIYYSVYRILIQTPHAVKMRPSIEINSKTI